MKKSPSDKILMFLKMQGKSTARHIADELAITKEGARKHLLNLATDGLVTPVLQSDGVGRPSTYYTLTDKGENKFPDSHADITVQLIQSVRKLLGENALDLLINDREATVYKKYRDALATAHKVEEKLDIITKIRTEEGYMAHWIKEGNHYFFVENHCPICAAAAECQGFCRTELKNFQQLFDGFSVERIEHIINGGSRCTYRITSVELA